MILVTKSGVCLFSNHVVTTETSEVDNCVEVTLVTGEVYTVELSAEFSTLNELNKAIDG